MAELTFTYGTMAAGKSTLALQLCWQLRQSRSDVALWTFRQLLERGIRILVIDEVQFASVGQVDALARLVDDHLVDVHAFGLSADFLLNVFPGSARLFAIADLAHELPLTSTCWCGKRGRCNARVVDGVVAREGSQFFTGDVSEGQVHYQVLCRTHYRLGQLGPVD
jgi:thymidine kinase